MKVARTEKPFPRSFDLINASLHIHCQASCRIIARPLKHWVAIIATPLRWFPGAPKFSSSTRPVTPQPSPATHLLPPVAPPLYHATFRPPKSIIKYSIIPGWPVGAPPHFYLDHSRHSVFYFYFSALSKREALHTLLRNAFCFSIFFRLSPESLPQSLIAWINTQRSDPPNRFLLCNNAHLCLSFFSFFFWGHKMLISFSELQCLCGCVHSRSVDGMMCCKLPCGSKRGGFGGQGQFPRCF